MINTYLAAKGFIYYSTTPIQGLSGPIPGESPAIHVYDLKERKDKVLLDGAQRFALSFDGSKLLYEAEGGRDGHTYGIIDAKPDGPKKVGDGALNLGGMRAQIDPAARVEADLQRSLAAGAGLFLRSIDERRGLGEDA